MSIEAKIDELIVAITALTAAVSKGAAAPATAAQPKAAAPATVPPKKAAPAPAPEEDSVDETASDDLAGEDDTPDFEAIRADVKAKIKEILAEGDDGRTKAKAILTKQGKGAKNLAEIKDGDLQAVLAALVKAIG